MDEKLRLMPLKQSVFLKSGFCLLPIPKAPEKFQTLEEEEKSMFSRISRCRAFHIAWLRLFLAVL